MTKPELSIILVSFNTSKMTVSCVESIVANTKLVNYEIIVVDNASEDGSFEKISKFKSQMKIDDGRLKVIKNTKNIGFGAANNQGIKIANGEYILFLNTDTVVRDNVISQMLDWAKKKKKFGAATCALTNEDGSIQASGGSFPTLPRIITWMLFIDDLPLAGKIIKSFHPHTPDYFSDPTFTSLHEQDWITGAFFLVKANTLAQLNGFDEDYFMYVEEVDLCFRIKKLGLSIWYIPDWSIIHFGGASGSGDFSVIQEFKSLILFYQKHMQDWQVNALRFLLKTGAILRIGIFAIVGKPTKPYAKALDSI